MKPTPHHALLLTCLLLAACGAAQPTEPAGPKVVMADLPAPPPEAAPKEPKKMTVHPYDAIDWSNPAAVIAAAQKPGGLPAPPDVMAPPADADITASGLASKVIRAGRGTMRPKASDTVSCHYSGWQTDGTNFDASYKRGKPSAFPLNRVIAGWTEGLQLMVIGEKRRFWIPEKLAYGGRPGAPSGMLVFDVELIGIR